ncbi:RNA-binding protein [Actinophytocola sp. KF-1]
MAQTIWDDPTDEQSVLLQAILATRGDDGSWPALSRLAEHVRHRFDVRAVLDSFPAAETGSGIPYRAVWESEDEVGLTLAAGLLTVDYEIAPYLAIVRTCAARVAKAGPVTVTSGRFYRQFGEDHTFHVRTFPSVLQREPLGATAEIRADGDDWSITFGEEFAAFRSVRHLRDYVRTSLGKPAAPETRAEYVDPALLRALAATDHPARDRLLAVLRELNSNYAARNPYATLLLHRAVTAGNTEVVDMADVPPPGSLDALIRAIVDRS